jgi:hypothetical protein
MVNPRVRAKSHGSTDGSDVVRVAEGSGFPCGLAISANTTMPIPCYHRTSRLAPAAEECKRTLIGMDDMTDNTAYRVRLDKPMTELARLLHSHKHDEEIVTHAVLTIKMLKSFCIGAGYNEDLLDKIIKDLE